MDLDDLNKFLTRIKKKFRDHGYDWPTDTKQITLLLGEREVEFFENTVSSHSTEPLLKSKPPFDAFEPELFSIRVIKTKTPSQFEAVFSLEKL